MQIPLNGYGRDALILFKFVWRQSGFAFFGAITSVVALFYFTGDKKEFYERRKKFTRKFYQGEIKYVYQ